MKYDFYNSTNWTPPGTPGVSKKSQKYFTNRSFALVRQNSAKIEINSNCGCGPCDKMLFTQMLKKLNHINQNNRVFIMCLNMLKVFKNYFMIMI